MASEIAPFLNKNLVTLFCANEVAKADFLKYMTKEYYPIIHALCFLRYMKVFPS